MKRLFFLFYVLMFSGVSAQNFDATVLDSIVRCEGLSGAAKLSAVQSEKTGNYDLKYLRTEWSIDPRIYFMSGKVTYYFTVLEDFSQMFFDLSDTMISHRFIYHGITTFNPPRPGDHTVQIDLPVTLSAGTYDSVTIFFLGEPAGRGFGSFAQSSHDGDSILSTFSEPYGASEWFPCKNTLTDKVDSLDILITLPVQYLAGSNGKLVLDTPLGDSLHLMHWKSRYPIATYLIAFAATNYAVIEEAAPLASGDTVHVLNYLYPEDSADYITSVIPMIQLFSDLFGDYPFKDEKYGHAQWNWGGGMEHQTMSFMVDASVYELVAHELAHQWFGDKVTCGSWQDIWLNEGFATYLAGLVYENLSPQYWYPYKLTNLVRALRDSTNSVFVEDTTDVARLFKGSVTYSKAMYLLHMLRWKFGDDVFFKAVYNYINDPDLGFGFARTSDLQRHLEAESGFNLNEFFNDWFYGAGYPSHQVKWSKNGDGTIAIQIHQTTNNPTVSFFEMPLPLQFKDAEHDTIIRVEFTANDQQFLIGPLPFTPDTLKFDPDLWIASQRNTVTYDAFISEGLLIYPNPAGSEVTVSYHGAPGEPSGLHEISIYDMAGALRVRYDVSTLSFFEPVTLDVSFLFAGCYLLQFNSDGQSIIKKLIKL